MPMGIFMNIDLLVSAIKIYKQTTDQLCSEERLISILFAAKTKKSHQKIHQITVKRFDGFPKKPNLIQAIDNNRVIGTKQAPRLK